MNDRIKIAEAMGWQKAHREIGMWFNDAPQYCKEDMRAVGELPDPFTNPTDDYAVLEWMRGITGKRNEAMLGHLRALWSGHYVIGDYARAALKVLDND